MNILLIDTTLFKLLDQSVVAVIFGEGNVISVLMMYFSLLRVQSAGAALEELLIAAKKQDYLTVGVYESAKVMNV